jgi:nucleoside-diphosphate-sugar epimerase
MKVLVTGASGFIGSFLCPKLAESGHFVVACGRSPRLQDKAAFAAYPTIGDDKAWRRTLVGVDAIVHLAGLTKAEPGARSQLEDEYRRINAEATRALARQAKLAGLKRFIFMSSLHAVAAESDELITDQTLPHPISAYGRSKLAAEKAIAEELDGSSCAYTVLRPPLVYGAGNQANFGLLLKLVKTRFPLPFASLRNRRSFLYVENLVDLMMICLGNPNAFGKTFLPSDGEDVSTPDLIRAIAKMNSSVAQRAGSMEQGDRTNARQTPHATRHSARLFPLPEGILKVAGRLPGLGALRKLTSSLYVDGGPLRRDLQWTPPFTMEEGLRRTMASG